MNNEPSNPFAVAAGNTAGAIQVAQSKEAQQIQAQLVVAKKFPRDQHAAFQRIIEACKRKGLAEEASYLYARGGTTITGASIRLLEVVAQQWGNFKAGIIELDNDNGESRVEAFAWDLESNAYDSKTFTVRHERHTRDGITKLTDARDQYELVANFAARRKRACMEAIIPRDIIDAALEQCDKTLKAGHTESLTDRVRKMTSAFAEYGVTVPMIEKRLQHKLEACIEQELVLLRKIFVSLKDGMSKREDWFDVNASEITRPKFESDGKDEKAEAAAGLAPAETEAPKAEPPKRGRPKKEAAAPAQPVVQQSPTVAETPSPTQAPPAGTEPPPAGGDLFSSPAYGQLRDLMAHSQVTEPELITVCKQRGLMEPTQAELRQLSDEKLTDLAEMWPVVAGQIRINRSATRSK